MKLPFSFQMSVKPDRDRVLFGEIVVTVDTIYAWYMYEHKYRGRGTRAVRSMEVQSPRDDASIVLFVHFIIPNTTHLHP